MSYESHFINSKIRKPKATILVLDAKKYTNAIPITDGSLASISFYWAAIFTCPSTKKSSKIDAAWNRPSIILKALAMILVLTPISYASLYLRLLCDSPFS